MERRARDVLNQFPKKTMGELVVEDSRLVLASIFNLIKELSIENFAGGTRSTQSLQQTREILVSLCDRLLMVIDRIRHSDIYTLSLEVIHKILIRSEFDPYHVFPDDTKMTRTDLIPVFRTYKSILKKVKTHLFKRFQPEKLLNITNPTNATDNPNAEARLFACAKLAVVLFFRLPEVGDTIIEYLSGLDVSYRLCDYEARHEAPKRDAIEKKKEEKDPGLVSSPLKDGEKVEGEMVVVSDGESAEIQIELPSVIPAEERDNEAPWSQLKRNSENLPPLDVSTEESSDGSSASPESISTETPSSLDAPNSPLTSSPVIEVESSSKEDELFKVDSNDLVAIGFQNRTANLDHLFKDVAPIIQEQGQQPTTLKEIPVPTQIEIPTNPKENPPPTQIEVPTTNTKEIPAPTPVGIPTNPKEIPAPTQIEIPTTNTKEIPNSTLKETATTIDENPSTTQKETPSPTLNETTEENTRRRNSENLRSLSLDNHVKKRSVDKFSVEKYSYDKTREFQDLPSSLEQKTKPPENTAPKGWRSQLSRVGSFNRSRNSSVSETSSVDRKPKERSGSVSSYRDQIPFTISKTSKAPLSLSTPALLPIKENPNKDSQMLTRKRRGAMDLKNSSHRNSDGELAKYEVCSYSLDESSPSSEPIRRIFYWSTLHSSLRTNDIKSSSDSELKDISTTDDTSWKAWFGVESMFFVYFLKEWIDHVELMFKLPFFSCAPGKNVIKVVTKKLYVDWRSINGFYQFLDVFLYILQHYPPNSKTFSNLMTSMIRCEPKLLNYYLRISLSRTPLNNIPLVAASLAKIQSWFNEFGVLGLPIPPDFDIPYFCSVLEILFETDHHQILCRLLSFLYDIMDYFGGDPRKALMSFLLDKYFFSLFLHWDTVTRNYFHQFILWKTTRLKRKILKTNSIDDIKNVYPSFMDPEVEVRSDVTIYSKIQCLIQNIEDQVRDNNCQYFDKNLMPYTLPALTEYKNFLSRNEVWAESSSNSWKLNPLFLIDSSVGRKSTMV